MDRLALVVACAIAIAPAIALSADHASKDKHATSEKHAPTLHLVSYDAKKREAIIELHGVAKAPANFFTFTDERERHFVAAAAHCEEKDGARVCRLEIPAGYEKHPLASLVLHLHGLHGRTIAAPASDLARAQSANAPDGTQVEKGDANVDGGA